MRITEAKFNFFGGVQKVRVLPESRVTSLIGQCGSGKTTLLKALYHYFNGERELEKDETVEIDSKFTRLAFVWAEAGEEILKGTPLKVPIIGKENEYFDTVDILKDLISVFNLDPSRLRKSKSGGHIRLYTMLEAAAKISPDGILLIDEPERHLDLENQRLICKALSKALPEGHVIVATHSPCVVSDQDELVEL